MKKLAVGFFVANGLWLGASLLLGRPLLPSPLMVYPHLFRILPLLLTHLSASLSRVLVGLGGATLVGLLGGIAMGRSRWLDKIGEPLLYLAYPAPKLAFLPVILLLFGLGELSKTLMVFLILVFPMTIQIRDAIKGISSESYEVFQSLGASKWQRLLHITLPAGLTQVLTAVRLSIGTALSVLFFAEVYGDRTGLGFFIMDAWGRINYLDMYSGLLMMSALGLLLFLGIDTLSFFILKWQRPQK